MNSSRFVFAVCLLWHSATAAQAAPSPEAKAEASQHFSRGVELFQEEAYRAALVEFQRAYEVAPDYRLLYNIAQAKLQVQDYLGAAQSYEAYLAEGGKGVPPDRRVSVEQAMTALRERIARVSIGANRDGADVFLDDQKIGTTPLQGTVLMNVGRHRLSARTRDGATDARVIDVAGGDIADVKFELAPPITEKTIVVREGDQPMSLQRKLAVVSWSVGGALLVGGAVTAVLTSSASDDLDSKLNILGVDDDSVQDQRDTIKTLALTTDILLATGGAAAVAGTLMWLLDRPDAEQKETSAANLKWGLGLGSLNVSGQF
jgi:hypothetical protein